MIFRLILQDWYYERSASYSYVNFSHMKIALAVQGSVLRHQCLRGFDKFGTYNTASSWISQTKRSTSVLNWTNLVVECLLCEIQVSGQGTVVQPLSHKKLQSLLSPSIFPHSLQPTNQFGANSMEVSTTTLQSSCSFPLRAPKAITNDRRPSLSFIRTSCKNFSLCSKIPKGFHLLVKPVRFWRLSVVAAIIGDETSVPNDCSSGEVSSVSDFSNPTLVGDEPREHSEKGEKEGGVGSLDDHKMTRICDKLIEVFMVDKPTPTDWRRLLAFSREWDDIRPHFFMRCQDRADAEDDPGMKHEILRLARKLKEIDEDVQRHNELLKVVRGAPSDINDIVAKRRKDFTKEFFVHLHTVSESYFENLEEQNALASIGNKCLAVVQAYDSATNSIEALNAAELKFQDIIDSPSVDAACRKIDHLAEKNQLDSTLVMMITKAWSAAKESSMTKDEVKDVLYHLYATARGNLQKLMPKEIRIVKYLLTIEDPEECLYALQDAFTPGEELEGKDVDNLFTTPEKLHSWIKAVVDAYHFSREGTLIREARDLMNPKIIKKLEDLQKVVENKFL